MVTMRFKTPVISFASLRTGASMWPWWVQASLCLRGMRLLPGTSCSMDNNLVAGNDR